MDENTAKNVLETALDEVLPKMAQPVEILNHLPGAAPAASHYAIPDDMRHVDLTEAVDRLATKLQPWRRAGTAKLQDLASLIAWANRHKGETSALFADIGAAPSLTCIADYMGAGAPVMDHETRDPKASHCRHRALYTFPMSKEWKLWTGVNNKALDKAEFGEFIEANAKDLLDPTPNLPERPYRRGKCRAVGGPHDRGRTPAERALRPVSDAGAALAQLPGARGQQPDRHPEPRHGRDLDPVHQRASRAGRPAAEDPEPVHDRDPDLRPRRGLSHPSPLPLPQGRGPR